MLYSGLKSKRKLILIFSFLPFSSIYFNPLGPVRGPKDQKLSKLPKTLKWMIRSGLSYINFKKIIFQIFLPFFLGVGITPILAHQRALCFTFSTSEQHILSCRFVWGKIWFIFIDHADLFTFSSRNLFPVMLLGDNKG